MASATCELGFLCPKCGVPMEDCWEILAAGEVHRLTCQCCGAVFNGLIVECDACGAEDFISSTSEIDAEGIACSSCGHRNHRDGADDEEPYF